MSMSNTEKTVKDIRRKTRCKFSTEEKIRIVLDGLRGECSVAELCRKEGINLSLAKSYFSQRIKATSQPDSLDEPEARVCKGIVAQWDSSDVWSTANSA